MEGQERERNDAMFQDIFSILLVEKCPPCTMFDVYLVLGVWLHHQAEIDLGLELLQGEICQGHAVPAVHVLVLVLDRSVNYQQAVVVHKNAAAGRAFALTVVFGRREDREHLTTIAHR